MIDRFIWRRLVPCIVLLAFAIIALVYFCAEPKAKRSPKLVLEPEMRVFPNAVAPAKVMSKHATIKPLN
jgi:hypothetical protein